MQRKHLYLIEFLPGPVIAAVVYMAAFGELKPVPVIVTAGTLALL